MSFPAFPPHTTPESTKSASIKKLQRDMGIDLEPVMIPVEPLPGEPLNNCHLTVKKKIDQAGGSAVCGWLVFETKDFLIEAIFHSIWKSPDGTLIDVTRHSNHAEKVIFLPLEGSKWDGTMVPGHRLALKKCRPVFRSIAIQAAREKLDIQTHKKNGPGSQIAVEDVFDLHLQHTVDRDECFCGSKIFYSACCKKRTRFEQFHLWGIANGYVRLQQR